MGDRSFSRVRRFPEILESQVIIGAQKRRREGNAARMSHMKIEALN
jgi:hypothetical protein